MAPVRINDIFFCDNRDFASTVQPLDRVVCFREKSMVNLLIKKYFSTLTHDKSNNLSLKKEV